ncbi:hypothetical protein Tco_0610459 [Tanacetum coccineum]
MSHALTSGEPNNNINIVIADIVSWLDKRSDKEYIDKQFKDNVNYYCITRIVTVKSFTFIQSVTRTTSYSLMIGVHYGRLVKESSEETKPKVEEMFSRYLRKIMKIESDIKNMTLNEYVECKSEKEMRCWKSIRSKGSPKRDEVLLYPDSDEEYYRPSHFFDQPPHTPNTPLDKKDSGLDEILDDLFKIGAESLKRMEKEKVQNGCDDDISRC